MIWPPPPWQHPPLAPCTISSLFFLGSTAGIACCHSPWRRQTRSFSSSRLFLTCREAVGISSVFCRFLVPLCYDGKTLRPISTDILVGVTKSNPRCLIDALIAVVVELRWPLAKKKSLMTSLLPKIKFFSPFELPRIVFNLAVPSVLSIKLPIIFSTWVGSKQILSAKEYGKPLDDARVHHHVFFGHRSSVCIKASMVQQNQQQANKHPRRSATANAQTPLALTISSAYVGCCFWSTRWSRKWHRHCLLSKLTERWCPQPTGYSSPRPWGKQYSWELFDSKMIASFVRRSHTYCVHCVQKGEWL